MTKFWEYLPLGPGSYEICLRIYVFVAAKAAWNLENSKVSGAPSHTLNEIFKDFVGF